jgi:3-oxoacyl-[acyl-carrier-protein] synthase II
VRRVAVTGLGAVTPIGNDAPSTWRAAVAGESGIDFIKSFDASGFPVRVAAEVKDFDAGGLVSTREARRLDRNVLLALAAAVEAKQDAGLRIGSANGERVDRSVQTDARAKPARPEGGTASGALDGFDPARAGVVLGSAIGGFLGIMEQSEVLEERGADRVSPYFIPSVLVDSASGQIAISLGMRGPNYAPVSACATGSHAVGEGAEIIRRGDADVVLAGGTEACMHPLILAGFCAMRGLAAEEEHPPRASRPFDATRAGFVMGEGACVLVLEELEAARKRGAKVYAEVLGYGASNDAYHMAAPDPASVGVAEMMTAALARARVDPADVDYVNAHGTSTPLGDLAETKALKDVFGDHAYQLAVSSTKSMMGHCFGAAGAIEAMMCVLAIHEGTIPPTINYEHPDPECDLDYVPNEARRARVDVALSNAMGLGGHNGCVLFGRADRDSDSGV